jgi:hypothetical protein
LNAPIVQLQHHEPHLEIIERDDDERLITQRISHAGMKPADLI